jgi:uncharacterized protein (TIGR04552 family)
MDQLTFRHREGVEAYIKLLCYDPHSPQDLAELRGVVQEAVEHLRIQHGYKVSDAVAQCLDPIQLFLWASEPGPYFQASLSVLKVAHVIFHVRARSLRHRMQVSDRDLFDLARERVRSFGELVRASGIELVTLDASEKQRDSTILKLLARRETLAAQLYDRIRFRVVIRNRSDVLPILLLMTRHLFPSNYVVPFQSRNDLLSFRQMLEDVDQAAPGVSSIRKALIEEQLRSADVYQNEFSHPDFQMINFVVDVPLRVDRFVDRATPGTLSKHGKVIFTLVEFQLFDLETFVQNEQGPSSHAHYKSRQRRAVLRRLVGDSGLEKWMQAASGKPGDKAGG